MKDSKIEWTDHTFNPWIGCTKVSPGCANCYAERDMDHRRHRVKWGKGQPRSRISEYYWRQPLKWNKEGLICDLCGTNHTADLQICSGWPDRRPRVFCASLADWLDDEVPIEWLADLLRLIHQTPNLDWLLLTKRPENWGSRITQAHRHNARELHRGSLEMAWHWTQGVAPANVWLGVSVEDQQRADERIPELLKIPAKVRFLSCEPLLGSVRLPTGCRGIHWIIAGGESGPKARPMTVEWVQSIADQCASAGVAFFMKQGSQDNWPAFKDLSSFPKTLQKREFPLD